MAQRIARALLALLCAVAVVYGTAMFPAAFDVELRTDQPDESAGHSTPVEATGGEPADSDSSGDGGADTGSPSDRTEVAGGASSSTATESATPTPAASGGADDGDSGTGGASHVLAGVVELVAAAVTALMAALVVTAVTVLLVALWSVTGTGSRSPSWFPAVPFPGFVSRIESMSVSLNQIPQVTTLAILSAGSGLARLADDVAIVADALSRSLAAGIGPVATGLGRALAALPRALGALVVAPLSALGSIGSVLSTDGVRGFLNGGVSGPTFLADEKPTSDARAESGPGPDPDGAEDDEPVESVVEAWVAMTELVTVRNRRTRTPVEYAQRAIDAGLPAGPVRRLTALFREVRYGGRPDSGDRVTAARRALDALTGGDE